MRARIRTRANAIVVARPHAAPSQAPRVRVTARKRSSSPSATRIMPRTPRCRVPAAAPIPKGSAMAMTSAAGFRLPKVEPGKLMTGMERGSASRCCKRPIAATAPLAIVTASRTVCWASGESSRALAPQASPKSDPHLPTESAAYGAPQGLPAAASHATSVVPRTKRAPRASSRVHCGGVAEPASAHRSAKQTSPSEAVSSKAANFGARKG